MGLPLSLVMPWRACEQAWQASGLWHALLYHIIGLFLFLVGLVIIDTALWYGNLVDDLVYLSPGELPIILLFAAFWFLGIQLGYFFAAFWTSCWGAGTERYRESFSRSLGRWYQLTPFHALWTLALFVAIDVISELQWNHWDNYNYGTWQYEFWEFIYSLLFLLPFLLYVGGVGWFTLWALSIPKNNAILMPKCRWPALCESCGYALVGLQRDQTCPECGRAVESSLQTPRGNVPLSTFTKMRMALFNPTALGGILLGQTRTATPAKALATTALLLLLSGPLGVLYILIVGQIAAQERWLDDLSDFIQAFVIGGLGVGISVMAGGVMLVLGAGSVVSLIDRLFGKRNNLPAASKAACYASGYVLFTAVLMYGFVGLLVVIVNYYEHLIGFYLIELIPLCLFVLCLALQLPYLLLIGRIVKAARFANT